ncbi:MAG: K(+)-transporting ATPase subunit C [Opitutaceae bacterium]|jgi:K+-transporting ATPase ATPase C chain|nr:K(+)-transporting ATPase subunit C [Opitutaceae bacterium]
MKALLSDIKTSLLLTAVFAVVLCGMYPLVVWAGGQAFFAEKANGSLVVDADGTVRGSALLAQSFTSPRTFHPRPSAAGTGYDASASSGSNLGPTSRNLADSIRERVKAYRLLHGLAADAPVPADAVTASGSGLDPHISVANAHLQMVRVARARALPVDQVRELVERHTDGRGWRVFGEPGVNVLLLNRALDALPSHEGQRAMHPR